jgi:two-component system sensor histidine kinase/response regulator
LTFLEDLLLWARLKVDGVESIKQPVDLYSITHKIIELGAPQIKLKSLNIINKVDPGQLVFAGEPAVKIVVRNLICNSIKFCGPEDTIEIYAEIIEDKMVFKVVANGPGMDDETLIDLF